MKLTNEAFSKWFITRDFQGIKVHETGEKRDGTPVKNISEAVKLISFHRLIDESTDPMDISEHIQLELRIEDEMRKAADPTGELVQKMRQRQQDMTNVQMQE